jgi:Ca2+-binding RTX toxin-like protein
MRVTVRVLLCAVVALAPVPLGAVPAGADTPRCFGRVPTIVGTPGDDVLVGAADTADVIFGGGGDDLILAEDFSEVPLDQPGDYLCGGRGDDVIRGSTGNDHLHGGPGSDNVDGWVGADVAIGGTGDDRVSDCRGEDAFNDDVDRLSGGPGHDSLCTQGSGADVLRGGPGDDLVVDLTCAGTKQLVGGTGDDRLESYENSFEGLTCDETGDDDPDRVRGGLGTDSAEVTTADVVSSVEDVTVH